MKFPRCRLLLNLQTPGDYPISPRIIHFFFLLLPKVTAENTVRARDSLSHFLPLLNQCLGEEEIKSAREREGEREILSDDAR